MLDRRRGVWVALLAAASLAVGAQAAQAKTPTIHIKVGVPESTLDQLRAGGHRAQAAAAARPQQPQQAHRPARLAAGGRAPTLSAAQGEALSRAAAGTTSEAAPMTAPPIGEQPDATQERQCFAASGVETPRGRVHNRFTYCQRVHVVAEYWEIENGVPVDKEGTTEANLEVFAQGDDHDRRARVWARIQKDSVDYDWGIFDNLFVAPNVPLSIIGQCSQGFDVCGATRGPATLPWVVWDNNSDWFYWDVLNREEPGQGRDKISYNQWYVELSTDNGEYHTLIPGKTNPRMLRCDSATYFKRGRASYPKACVFSEVIPHLTYSLTGDARSVAFHIFTAQTHPNDTYPLLVPFGVPMPRDKRIPGEYVADNPNAPGLHRITQALEPGQYLANGQHKDGACYKRGPFRDEYLDTGLPVPPDTPDQQCDEYPFASTLEGAANPYWDFSVKAVPQRDNSVAGVQLRDYYVNDRILAWDPSLDHPDQTNDRFYVEIK